MTDPAKQDDVGVDGVAEPEDENYIIASVIIMWEKGLVLQQTPFPNCVEHC